MRYRYRLRQKHYSLALLHATKETCGSALIPENIIKINSVDMGNTAPRVRKPEAHEKPNGFI